MRVGVLVILTIHGRKKIGALSRKELGMSLRDFKSTTVGLNANGLKLSRQWLLGRIDGSSVELRRGCAWSPSLLSGGIGRREWGWNVSPMSPNTCYP
jgi:mttA/Hcf106 family